MLGKRGEEPPSPVISELLQLLLTAGKSVVGGSVFEPWLLSFNPGQELHREDKHIDKFGICESDHFSE